MKHEQASVQRIRRGALSARTCLGIVVTVGAAACAPSPNPTHQTVDYYRTNAEARQAMLTKCENDLGALGKTPDCVNAREAEGQESIGRLRDLPPMGLLKDLDKKDSAPSTGAGGESPGAKSERTEPEGR